jgi:basic amino acid/polyamine antiporter, APA family
MFRALFRQKTDFPAASDSQMSRVLGLRDLTFFGIAAIIGGGIFSSVGRACSEGGPGVIWLFLICAVACGFAALCYAEFAARIPVSGSAYTYAYASFGELFAWIIGWALIMEYSIGNIYIAFSWSGYVTHMLDAFNLQLPRWLTVDYRTASRVFSQQSQYVTLTVDQLDAMKAWNTAPIIGNLRLIVDAPAVLINILITILVYRGIKESKQVSNAMVVLKLVIIIAVIAVGAFYIDIENYTPFNPSGMKGIMAGVSAVFFTYIGFDAVSTLAEESKNPERDLPKGMFYSLLICTVLYIFISLVLTGMVPYTLLNVDDPLAFALQYKGVHWLEYIVGASAIIAMTGVLLVFQMGQPRIWMSMSRDGLLPKKFAQIHPKYKTPGFSTIMTGVVVGLPIFFTDEAFVLDFTSIGTIFAFVLVCGGVLLLPQRKKGDGKGFRLWYINGQWLFPLICIGSGLLSWIFIPGYILEIISGGSDMMYTMAHRILWICLIGMSIFAWKNKWNLIPLCGVAICLYLLTGMTIENWKWFGIWFFIGLVFYFVYGRRKSKLNEA